MRFNWKNFKAGKIDVIITNQEEFNEFMQRCEKKGIKWRDGSAPTCCDYYTGDTWRISCGSGGALGHTVFIHRNKKNPTINYSEFALPAPADVPARVPTLEEMAIAAAILAIDMQKVKEAFVATRAALRDALSQFRQSYNDRLQALKKEQSNNE